jgi:hypothetical protein
MIMDCQRKDTRITGRVQTGYIVLCWHRGLAGIAEDAKNIANDVFQTRDDLDADCIFY